MLYYCNMESSLILLVSPFSAKVCCAKYFTRILPHVGLACTSLSETSPLQHEKVQDARVLEGKIFRILTVINSCQTHVQGHAVIMIHCSYSLLFEILWFRILNSHRISPRRWWNLVQLMHVCLEV